MSFTDSRILVFRLTSQKVYDKDVVRQIIRVVKDIVELYYFSDVKYSYVFQEPRMLLYFPEIAVNGDQIYSKIVNDISANLEKQEGLEKIKVEIEKNPDPVEDFDETLSKTTEPISEQDLKAYQESEATQHLIYNNINRFDFLISLIPDKSFFLENILYIASAFYRNERELQYYNRVDIYVDINNWLKISSTWDVDEKLASSYFERASKYCYTVNTLEEVLKTYSKEINTKILKYNEKRIIGSIRNMLLRKEDITANDLLFLFSEYVRRDHFFCKKTIYRLDGQECKPIDPAQMRPVANRFVLYVHETLGLVMEDSRKAKETRDIKRMKERHATIIKPLVSMHCTKFIYESCANYLWINFNEESSKSCIAFLDCVVAYDQRKISIRKAFMEDHFTSTASVRIKGPRDYEVERDIKETFFKMFANWDNVNWFIKWLGSFLIGKPDRVCLILYGPKGGNAKTTIVNAILKILGPFYANQARSDILVAGKGGLTCTPFEMELKNKRFTAISEADKTRVYSSSILKLLSGDDTMTGARKYMDPESFLLMAKLALLCNSIPVFDEVDEALLSRLYIIKCHGRFTNMASSDPETQRKDHHYPVDENYWNDTRLRSLAQLMVYEGFEKFIKEGLGKTIAQMEELRHWEKEGNPIKRFTEMVTKTNRGLPCRTSARELYQVFSQTVKNISYEAFKDGFSKYTNYKLQVDEGDEYYSCHHSKCTSQVAY